MRPRFANRCMSALGRKRSFIICLVLGIVMKIGAGDRSRTYDLLIYFQLLLIFRLDAFV